MQVIESSFEDSTPLILSACIISGARPVADVDRLANKLQKTKE